MSAVIVKVRLHSESLCALRSLTQYPNYMEQLYQQLCCIGSVCSIDGLGILTLETTFERAIKSSPVVQVALVKVKIVLKMLALNVVKHINSI